MKRNTYYMDEVVTSEKVDIKYFRRLLCNLLGNDVEKGLLPDDKEALYRMVEDISYYNAKNYFKF